MDTTLQEAAARLRHPHDHAGGVATHEAKARWVVALTLAMMIGELVVGYATHSLALTADGWHMATHAGALGLSALAYWFARTRAREDAFSFGTGKVHALAGYTSAIALAFVALWMMVESVSRFLRPEVIAFEEALPVAFLGLLVNVASVKLLHADDAPHHHDHDRDHDHPHHHGHGHGHDHNLRAAYMHVLADTLTSLLAIFALLGGRYLGFTFLDPLMGIAGGLVIARWSHGLCRDAAKQLLDVVPEPSLAARIRDRIERGFDHTHVVGLHLWEIGPRARACIVSIAAAAPEAACVYRDHLLAHEHLAHLTVEVHALGPTGDERRGS